MFVSVSVFPIYSPQKRYGGTCECCAEEGKASSGEDPEGFRKCMQNSEYEIGMRTLVQDNNEKMLEAFLAKGETFGVGE
jgi:hypothetical protein